MMNALHVGASGMLAQQFLVETTANQHCELEHDIVQEESSCFSRFDLPKHSSSRFDFLRRGHDCACRRSARFGNSNFRSLSYP